MINTDLIKNTLRCPQEGSRLEMACSGSHIALRCLSCRRVYPVVDEIPIMLVDSKRNSGIELEPLRALVKVSDFKEWHDDIENTIRIVETSNPNVWEWEDAAHWENIYKGALESGNEKGWKDRIAERWTLTKRTFEGLENPVILDVGCGEGQNIPLICPDIFSKST